MVLIGQGPELESGAYSARLELTGTHVASVSIENISKTYKVRRELIRAVDDLSLAVDEGELLVLVGPSGCGKTTTLRLVAGLERPSSGVIRIGDRVVNHVPPNERDLAMVFQNYALYRHMTVYENLAFGLKMRKVHPEDIQRMVRNAANLLGIQHLLDRKPGRLSGGERQRVAVGRAIVRTPKAFLFDEPLSNLDAHLRHHARTEIKTLQRRLATTMIYVTHDQEEAMTLGDRIAVLRGGRLQQCGPPLEIYHRPANRFVAGFFGNPPMNMIEGRIAVEGSNVVFVSALGNIPVFHEGGLIPRFKEGAAVLGIRPEYIQPTVSGQTDSAANDRFLLGHRDIVLIEPLGDVATVHLRITNEMQLVARVPYDVAARDLGSLSWSIDVKRLHIFSASAAGERMN